MLQETAFNGIAGTGKAHREDPRGKAGCGRRRTCRRARANVNASKAKSFINTRQFRSLWKTKDPQQHRDDMRKAVEHCLIELQDPTGRASTSSGSSGRLLRTMVPISQALGLESRRHGDSSSARGKKILGASTGNPGANSK